MYFKRSFFFNSGNGLKEMCPFLALFILVLIPSICKGLQKNNCNVVPKDPYIEVGSNIEIVCQSSCIQEKIFWTLDNRSINESLSKTVNTSHTVLSLRNFTKPTATLQCHSADTQQVLGGTIIRTYSKPSKISCVLHKFQAKRGTPQLFSCDWEHHTDSSLGINYTVLCCTNSSCQPPIELCNSRETKCTSNYEDVAREARLLWNDNIIVKVRAKSAAWETFSDNYEFTPLKILKIPWPKFDVTAFSDRLLIEWKITPRVSNYQYHCQVKYSKALNEGTPERVLNKTLKNRDKGEMTIEEVESCHNYTFMIRCALHDAPWSDWSNTKTVLTKLNKNNFKPQLWRRIAEPDKNGVRKVHAMWTEIPSECQDTFTFALKQTPYKEHMTGVEHTVALCDSSVCDVNQDAHRINLTVFQNEVLFLEDSVHVPAIGESLPQVTDIQATTLEGVILVSWKAPAQPVSGYVIDYTHNGNQNYWKETKYTNATLFDLLDKKPYNITVTPLFGDKTGQGTQVLQICSRVGDPGNVTVIGVQAKDRSAFVSWSVKSEEACTGVVVHYTVFYSAEKGPQLNATVDGTMRNISLKDLNPKTRYGFYVKATALTGSASSSKRFFETKRFDPRLITTLSVCGGILIVLVLSFGLCCAVQWKKFKEKPVPNPAHSSVALWASTRREKEKCPFQFHNPSTSDFGMVYPEDAQRTATSPLITGWSDNPEHSSVPASLPAPDVQNTHPVEPLETQHPFSHGESTELLASESMPSSPYRSQSPVPVEIPAQRSSKRVPVKHFEKTPPLTVYVTLDMFEQGQGR
uniref:interleukin-6 receptor subunit beta-like n=1 Tax=Scatophagus argus TaxID=75038 RepID=UPI001ED85928|nr:interleukin-6 receptor subunit beta-like [Scatophagus argus]